MAPEVIKHQPYGTAADVYSFSILVWELLTGLTPYSHLSPIDAIYAVADRQERPELPASAPAAVRTLLTACWPQDAAQRWDFHQVVQHLVAAQISHARAEASLPV